MKKLLILCVTCLLFLFPLVANASIIVDPSFFTGSRSTSTLTGGITASDAWRGRGRGINNDGFKIAWDISLVGTEYTYSYTISNESDGSLSKELSHWILEVTDPSSASDFWNVTPEFSSDSPKTWKSDAGKSNPYMPTVGIYGLKWEAQDGEGGIYTVSFNTDKNPVWGDFYAKGGTNGNGTNKGGTNGNGTNKNGVFATAYNTGFGGDPTTTDFTNWIPTPDGGTPVPIPGTVLLLGSGLIGLVGFRKKIVK